MIINIFFIFYFNDLIVRNIEYSLIFEKYRWWLYKYKWYEYIKPLK